MASRSRGRPAVGGNQGGTQGGTEQEANRDPTNDEANKSKDESRLPSRGNEKDMILIPKFNGNNYSIWLSTMAVYLEYKGLWKLCEKEPEKPRSEKVNRQILQAWLILSSRIKPNIFNSIKVTCERSLHKIWERLKNNYAKATIYGIYQVWTNFTRVPYTNNLLKFVTKIEAALAEVNLIGIDTKQSIVSVSIMEKITEKRPELMERLLGDMNTLSNPTMLLDKLRELANHKQVQQLVDSSSSNKHSMALATSASLSSQPNH